MPTRLYSIVIDADDPPALGRWWGDALGWQIVDEDEGETDVAESDDGRFALVFVGDGDAKVVKNRVHLDLASDTREAQAALVNRLVAAGATRVDVGQEGRDDAVPWVVLADPEGNELCVLEPRERHRGAALASVVVDCTDTRRVADFWRAVLGWDELPSDGPSITLVHPEGHLPDLDFVPVPEPKTVKDHVHIDVAPWARDDQAAEVQRILDLGATHADVGQGPDVTWVVLADPEDNEFCVLSSRDD